MLQHGERIATICQLGSNETGGKVTVGVLRRDVMDWSQSASMGEQFTRALGIWRRNAPVNNDTLLLSPDAKSRFIDSMDEADGKVELACELSGIAPEVIYALIRDRKGKHYDADFAEQVAFAEGRRMSVLRENLLDAAATPGLKGARIAATVLATAMPALHGATQEVKHVGEVTVNHALAPEVVAASAERTRKLMVGRVDRALPANVGSSAGGKVIDITPMVRERAEAGT